MILEEKTQIDFGYNTSKLNSKSKNIIYYLCEYCENIVTIQFSSYWNKKRKDICKSCAIRFARAYAINENYFDGKNLQSYYWAGYFFAAATLYADTKRIAFELSVKDIKEVERIKNDLNFAGPIVTRTRYSSWRNKHYQCSSINFASKKIFNSLKEYGVTENKTIEFIPPDILNVNNENFNVEYAKCFFIGMIDGDGSINMHSDAQPLLEITQYGNYSLCSWVKELIFFLLQEEIKSNISKNREKLFKFTVSGKKANKLFNILHNTNVEKLNRKWNNSELIIF